MINTVINDRYRIDSELGTGGLGTVYRAYDTLLERHVAIKIFNKPTNRAEQHTRLLREAQIVSRLHHPHIVTIYDAGQNKVHPYIVMELISGPTLRELPQKTIESSLTLISQICSALDHAHQAGVIHRDLKPENVLMENGENAKLVDFGLARKADIKSVESDLLAGTLAYISPEQISGDKIDARADLYSLGIIFYEQITGELPFQSDEILPLLQKHLAEPPAAPKEKIPDLPSDINDLILRLLSKNPKDRPDSAWEVYRSVESLNNIESNYLISLHADKQPAVQKYNLPTPPTSFIGRLRELDELNDLLARPDTRMLTIVGAGGMGKTRLSLEVGRAALANFADGVYFIPLAAVTDIDQIPAEIAESVGTGFIQGSEPRQHLLDFLQNKELLLVMDNYEHLLDGVEFISEILRGTSNVKVLATSRQKLGLSSEQIYRLEGLEASGQRGDDSTRLFEERARLVSATFEITEDNFPAVHQVGQYVGGMPLGIELAASWIEFLSPEEIAAEMQESLDFFDIELQDLPDRHRNMRAVIDQTWNLLSAEERNGFKKSAVFRGRFNREAFNEVIDIDAKLQRSLLNKSVIQRDRDGYYQIHELMRQYAQEKLAEDAEQNQRIRDRHADYFCGLVEQYGQRVLAGEHHLIAPLYENIREALEWSITRKKLANLRISVPGLLFYFSHRGIIYDGVRLIEKFINNIEPYAQSGEESGLVLAQNLMVLAYLYRRGYVSRLEETEQLINRCLDLLQASSNYPREQAFIYVFILWLNTSSPIEENRRYFEMALDTYQELGDEWGVALAHDQWAWALTNSGDAISGEPHHRAALKIYQQLMDGRGTAACLAGIGYAFWTRHEYDKALHLINEGLNIIESLDLYNDILIYYTSIFDLTLIMGDYHDAYDLANKGYSLFQENGGRLGLVNMLVGMIKASIELDEYSEALARIDELKNVYAEGFADNPRIKGFMMRTSGHVDLGLNHPKNAQKNYRSALKNTHQASLAFQISPDDDIVTRYDIVIWIARWLKNSARFAYAAEIAYFVSMYENFPRTFYSIIRDYQHLLTELENHLSAEELSAAQGRAENRELESTLEELLDLLSE